MDGKERRINEKKLTEEKKGNEIREEREKPKEGRKGGKQKRWK